MGRSKLVDKNTRKIMKGSNGSYTITIPMEMIKELGWREKQKVVFEKRGEVLKIKDWEK